MWITSLQGDAQGEVEAYTDSKRMQKSQVNIVDQEQLKKESREQDLNVSDLKLLENNFGF